MKTSHTQRVPAPTIDVECPWCAGDATIGVITVGARREETFICATCSVDAEMAPEPVGRLVATAA